MKEGNIKGYMICLYHLMIFYINQSFRPEIDLLCLATFSTSFLRRSSSGHSSTLPDLVLSTIKTSTICSP